MIKSNYFVKFIKKIYFTINRLIKNNLNKLNPIYLQKVRKSNKFILSLALLVGLFLSYLSIPNIYDKTEINKRLNIQLKKKFDLNFNLSENFEYNFLPKPHFIYKNSSITNDQSEISQIENLKIYISLNSIFSYKNFKVQNLILEKSNFNLNKKNYNFFTKLLESNFRNTKMVIKDSKIFFKNENDEVLFINKISNMEYSFDNKNLQNKVISKNQLFNIPYSIELNQKNNEKKILSKVNVDFLKLRIDNELDVSKKIKKGLINFKLHNDRFISNYQISENNFIFNLFDNFDNSKLNYKGEFNFSPFYSKLEGSIEEINFSHLINSNSLILQFLKTEILNNKNLNIDINIKANKSKNLNNLSKIFLVSKIQEGLIDFDNTKFSWKDDIDFKLNDSLIYVKNGHLILDGKLDIEVRDYDKIYKFLLTPKKHRAKLKLIETNFTYNFDQQIFNFNNILIDKKNNKNINELLKTMIFKESRHQNKIYLKNSLNSALKFYSG